MLTKLFKLLKKLTKSVLWCTVVLFIAYNILPLLIWWSDTIGYFSLYPHTYVSYINTPNHTNATVINALEDFNRLADGKIVKYKEGIIRRPLFIMEADLNKKESKYTTLGVTVPMPFYSLLFLDKNLKSEYLRDVSNHEFCHVYGAMHVDDPKDLMSAIYYPPIDENSRLWWAKWIENTFYK